MRYNKTDAGEEARAATAARRKPPFGGFKSLPFGKLCFPASLRGTMKKYINVDGNAAASNIAYYLSEAIEIYPITPSSPMAENTEHLSNKGFKNIFNDTELEL